MKNQFKIFGALLLSLAAGMTVSEVISYQYEQASVADLRQQVERSVPAVIAGLTLRDEAVN